VQATSTADCVRLGELLHALSVLLAARELNRPAAVTGFGGSWGALREAAACERQATGSHNGFGGDGHGAVHGRSTREQVRHSSATKSLATEGARGCTRCTLARCTMPARDEATGEGGR